MNPELVVDELARARVLPVVVAADTRSATGLAGALIAGGLPIAEVTFRTPAAANVLRAIADNPAMLVGAGTIVSTDQVDQALDAGARFIVSPGFDPGIVRRCLDRGVPVFPGIATATEIQAALGAGLTTVKFFPAEALGGVVMVAALSAPFGTMRFIPTGGIGPRKPRRLSRPPGCARGRRAAGWSRHR